MFSMFENIKKTISSIELHIIEMLNLHLTCSWNFVVDGAFCLLYHYRRFLFKKIQKISHKNLSIELYYNVVAQKFMVKV